MTLHQSGHVLAIVNLLLHLGVLMFIVGQLRWRYCYAAWTRAWGSLSVAMLCMVPFRLDDLDQPFYWRMLLAAPMTLGLFAGFWQLARLFLREH